MGKRRRNRLEETFQRCFYFVFTTDESQDHQPLKISMPRFKCLEKRDDEEEAA